MGSGSRANARVREKLNFFAPGGSGSSNPRSVMMSPASRRSGLVETASGAAMDTGSPGSGYPGRTRAPVSRGPRRPCSLARALAGLPIVSGALGAVLAAVLARLRVPADHPLAVRRDVVERVGDDRVVAGAAVDVVDLPVAAVDGVVAVLAVQRVANGIPGGGHVTAAQRPQLVVAVAAERLVDALVGEDHVAAGAAVLFVVT